MVVQIKTANKCVSVSVNWGKQGITLSVFQSTPTGLTVQRLKGRTNATKTRNQEFFDCIKSPISIFCLKKISKEW